MNQIKSKFIKLQKRYSNCHRKNVSTQEQTNIFYSIFKFVNKLLTLSFQHVKEIPIGDRKVFKVMGIC